MEEERLMNLVEAPAERRDNGIKTIIREEGI